MHSSTKYAGVSGAESSRYIADSAGRTLECIDKTSRLRPGCINISCMEPRRLSELGNQFAGESYE